MPAITRKTLLPDTILTFKRDCYINQSVFGACLHGIRPLLTTGNTVSYLPQGTVVKFKSFDKNRFPSPAIRPNWIFADFEGQEICLGWSMADLNKFTKVL